MNAAPSSVHVGIDVSKASLDIAVRPTGETWQVRHSATGIAELALRLSELRPALVVLEATGGYERATLATLHDYHIPVALLNPRQVREFARAAGRLAKTDRLDAQVLALFAERMQPQPQSAPDPEQGIMEELTVRRRQLVEALTAERNRLNQMTGPGWRSVVEHIEWLEGELARIEAQLKQAISDNPAYQARADLLQSVPAVGPVLSMTLLAHLRELGHLDGKEIAALVGVAPMNGDSGAYRGKRQAWGGRGAIRRVLYMAAVVAARHNPVIRAFYRRLCEAGKAKKVALTACMRKLLVILNAMVKHGRSWQPNYAQTH